ncbi:MAG: prepilin-type N-terminal cleavage/methylation domain-containing protein [Bacilli bacterium]|nr:prepilin-type N-terminal cleavage/methylation domain-containing protein [Bacilli bacterium]
MKNKGFTLIELLAVIIILAIIAVISTPVIMDLINRSRYGAFSSSKRNIERAAELYYARNAASIVWDNDISYVEIKTLKNKKYLAQNVVDVLTNMEIEDDTKVLLYREGRKVSYSLQLYNEIFFDWYQGEMIKAVKKDNKNLPNNVGDIKTIDLNTLIDQKLVDELRLPLELENRCVGYVEIEKVTTKDYEYNAYVDCLTNASTFASHYVSYGGKYLDEFNKAIETSDGGYIAVGESNSEVITKYGNIGKGKYDAIIVKFKSDGTVEWSRNFGGSNNENFYSVVESADGYVAVGATASNDLDMAGLFKGGNNDSVLVKYDKQGNLVHKISHGSSGTNGTDSFYNVIKVTDGYIVVGASCIIVKDGDLTGAIVPGNRTAATIIKYDNNFNLVWRSFFSGSFYDNFFDVKQTSDNGYIVSGNSSSYDHDMAGLGYDNVYVDTDAIIVKYDSNGNLQYKNSFKGSKHDSFESVIEVTDGYVVVGGSESINGDLEGLKKTGIEIYDGIIVKYDKTLSNMLWKKSFGGSDVDQFYDILETNDNQLIAVGYSKSNDYDLSNIDIPTGGYSNATIVRFNNNGTFISSKVFGGNNSDQFKSVIKTKDNNYIISGSTYSSDNNLKNFNKGHRDAILVSYDVNMNLIKNFNEPVIIIDKLKPINIDYGTSISLNYSNIYTTNNPEVDLKGWCSSYSIYPNNINYPYGMCLTPFNSDDTLPLINGDNPRNLKTIRQWEFEYTIDKQASNNFNWHNINIYLTGGGGSNIELSNFKLKFADGSVFSINDAVTNNYIEPLVIVSALLSYVGDYYFPNTIAIINNGGSTGIGNYPSLDMRLKPKKSKLVSIYFTSNRDIITNGDGLQIYELRNFDMSITPAK